MMGGIQAKCELSKYNEDVTKQCNHCLEADSTTDHIKWACKRFQSVREEVDPGLAAIPVEHLPLNVRNGVAPAMKVYGSLTYWGRQLPEGTDRKAKELLGVDNELQTPGENANKTEEREQALAIAEDPVNKNLNARQQSRPLG